MSFTLIVLSLLDDLSPFPDFGCSPRWSSPPCAPWRHPRETPRSPPIRATSFPVSGSSCQLCCNDSHQRRRPGARTLPLGPPPRSTVQRAAPPQQAGLLGWPRRRRSVSLRLTESRGPHCSDIPFCLTVSTAGGPCVQPPPCGGSVLGSIERKRVGATNGVLCQPETGSLSCPHLTLPLPWPTAHSPPHTPQAISLPVPATPTPATGAQASAPGVTEAPS